MEQINNAIGRLKGALERDDQRAGVSAGLELVAVGLGALVRIADALEGPQPGDESHETEAHLRLTLERAANWFDGYERVHRDKGTPESDRKADANAERAGILRAAAAGVLPSTGAHLELSRT